MSSKPSAPWIQSTDMAWHPSGVIVPAWLPRAALRRPDALAVRAGGGSLTYAELAAAVARAAGGLPVAPGTRVGIALPADLDFVVAVHAVLWRGATAVPLDLRLGDEERAVRAAQCDLVLDAPLVAGEPVAARDHDLDRPAAVIFTSGTT